MRKLLIISAIFGVVLSSSESMAQYRAHRGYAPSPRYYAPRAPRHNWVPYAIGGLALGMIGGYYYHQRRVCWDEIVDYDRYGDAIIARMCN